MEVQLRQHSQPHVATWQFAGQEDVGLLQGWSGFLRSDSSDSMRDSADFARQATARWWNYFDQKLTAVSWDDAKQRSIQSPQQEFSALLVLKAGWWFDPDQALAFAYLRRTWSGGLYLEFLAGHPMAEDSRISGIIRATLQCLAELARVTGGEWVWWEATKDSYEKYDGIVSTVNHMTETHPRVKDLFLVKAVTLQNLLHTDEKPTLAK